MIKMPKAHIEVLYKAKENNGYITNAEAQAFFSPRYAKEVIRRLCLLGLLSANYGAYKLTNKGREVLQDDNKNLSEFKG